MAIVLPLIAALGPIIGAGGLYLHLPIAFWSGVGIAALSLVMTTVSGAIKFPWIEFGLALVCASILTPWWFGVAIGLLAGTAVQAAGMVLRVGHSEE